MSTINYRPSDLVPLLGSLVLINEYCPTRFFLNLPQLQIVSKRFALATDLPLELRRYYEEIAIAFYDVDYICIANLNDLKKKGMKLKSLIKYKLGPMIIGNADWASLIYVNSKLRELETILRSLVNKLFSVKPISSNYPELCYFATTDVACVNFEVKFKPDPQRPSYQDNPQEFGEVPTFSVAFEISGYVDGKVNNDEWELDDGLSHLSTNDLDFEIEPGVELADFERCYLFSEIFQITQIGLWGLLNLSEIHFSINDFYFGHFGIDATGKMRSLETASAET